MTADPVRERKARGFDRNSAPPLEYPRVTTPRLVAPRDRSPDATAGSERRRVLIVDDDPAVVSAHARYVEHLGYDVERAADGIEALSKLTLGIDLVLLDISMPNMDGFEVARRIRDLPEHAVLPIVMVTGLDPESWYPRALDVGANDVISKPLDLTELRLRTRWLMELKAAHDKLLDVNVSLEHAIGHRTADLRAALEQMSEAKRSMYDAHLDTIRRLTIAAEYKDDSTAGHVARVGLGAAAVARKAGLSPGEGERIQHAAPLHDVGKIGIPDEVMLKRGELTDDERAIMREHTRIGAKLLEDSDSEVIRLGATIAHFHHERWDGSGYPEGCAGEAIPIEARICAVVDCHDAATMDRPFRAALTRDGALSLIRETAGTRFDPSVVEAFFTCLPEIDKAREEYPVQ